MNIEQKTINGLSVVFAELPDATSTTIQVLVKAGSVFEDEKTNGLSHFLEHMFFKGGKTYKTPKSVALALDTLGASFNAFTGEEYAGYRVKCAPMFLHQAIEVLADMLVHSQFPVPELEREKGVVIQEIKMYDDAPSRQVGDKWRERYYGKNSFGKSILGPIENVQSFTQDDLFRHKEKLYTKDSLVIAVAGALPDKNRIEETISELFGELPETRTAENPVFAMDLPTKHQEFFDKDTQQNHLIIGAEGFTIYDEERFAASMLMTIFGGMMSSRLFQHVREQKGLCYYIGGGHYAGDITGAFMIYAGMEKERRDMGLGAIYEEIATLLSGGISDEEFDQARQNTQGSMKMSIETSNQLAGFVANQVLYKNSVTTMDEFLAKYMALSKKQIENTAKRLAEESLYAYWIQ